MTLRQRYRAAKAYWYIAKVVDSILKERVAMLMAQADLSPMSGEWKRHQVYAQLIKEFPGTQKSHLAFAIELVKCFGSA